MAIDKSLSQAPQGLDKIDQLSDEPALEIEIQDPEALNISGPGFDIHMEKDGEGDEEFNKNLAEDMDESQLAILAVELVVILMMMLVLEKIGFKPM